MRFEGKAIVTITCHDLDGYVEVIEVDSVEITEEFYEKKNNKGGVVYRKPKTLTIVAKKTFEQS